MKCFMFMKKMPKLLTLKFRFTVGQKDQKDPSSPPYLCTFFLSVTCFGQYMFIVFLLHLHLPLNRKGRWGITSDFTRSILHFSLFSTALWDLLNTRLVHSLMLSSHLFFCLPCLLPQFTVSCKMVLAKPDE